MKLFRWKALIPTVLFLAVVTGVWVLLADTLIRRGIEAAGTALVGARVELASARLSLLHADLVLRGLQVTDPKQPMKNLTDVNEMVANVDLRALLRAKFVVETLAVRGMRFGTPRTTSGAIPRPSATSGEVTERVNTWAHSVPIPGLDLKGLTGSVARVTAINQDSLRTPREARAAEAAADSIGKAVAQTLGGAEEQPLIDSARALLDQLGASRNPLQAASQLAAARRMLDRLTDAKSRLATAQATADAALARVRGANAAIAAAREADQQYARGLLRLPALGGHDISMSLFGHLLTGRLQPYLYWLGMVDRHMPPGLDPRRSDGPKRARRAGTTYQFPLLHGYPTLLLEHADADVTIDSTSRAVGAYRATLEGLTTDPAIYGHPLTLAASRSGAAAGANLQAFALIDRTGAVPKDSLDGFVPGLRLDTIAVPAANATLDLGPTDVAVSLSRRGHQLAGTYRMTATAVRWSRTGDTATAAGPVGSAAWGQALLWRTLSGLPRVSIEARISGGDDAPHLEISSNVGDAVSQRLEQELGAEARRAEADALAKVNAIIAPQQAAAKQKLDALESGPLARVAAQRQQLDQVQADLQRKIAQLGNAPLPGIRLPRP